MTSHSSSQPLQQDPAQVLCIGSVLWDIIGRCPAEMPHGADRPGRITRLPGGVAMNIAMTLARFGMKPVLLSAVGQDAEGAELIAACGHLGLETGYLYRSADLPTDRYMAVEGANGLIAAIADAHSLEAAGAKILNPLFDGTLGSEVAPYGGPIALDGNLTLSLLDEIAISPAFAAADLRVAPASPGKAERLRPFLVHGRGTLYVNLEEAGLLCQDRFTDSESAARALLDRGAARVLVTDGSSAATKADKDQVHTLEPPKVRVARITGAGDTFMAAHIAAEARGEAADTALASALAAAASYVSGEPPL
ncbi:PfkB family carbohydrate kinase [Phaeobacter sp. QD34_3]|uniref:PfkB family carbohydrate kinase n=1 Tax=unclassified Phaeobacter TaxID=2621772 RepID=UPI00237FABB8|nr:MULTISPECIES: PfkB family carbohydrate kinase [unclassified Phaeobacter]MDE4131754.1 PfkB family carbohydrate kinase [Phaeobacter sp. QD34_3]MDE4135157.1 PfkB family carbohydrate kinase [Phaeobacter sp. QD34_24]